MVFTMRSSFREMSRKQRGTYVEKKLHQNMLFVRSGQITLLQLCLRKYLTVITGYYIVRCVLQDHNLIYFPRASRTMAQKTET